MTSSARHTCQISFIVLKVTATILLEHNVLQMLTAFLNSLLITRITFLILFYPSSFICFVLWISILYLRSCWGLKFSVFFITCDSRSKTCRRVQLSHHFPNVTIHFTDSRSTPSYFSELLYDRIISINFSVILSLQVQRFAT